MTQRYVDGLVRTLIVNVAERQDRTRVLPGLLIDLAGLDHCTFTAGGALLYVRVYESAQDRRAHGPP